MFHLKNELLIIEKSEGMRELLFTNNGGLGVREDHLDVLARSTLNIHEVRVGSLDKSFELILKLFIFVVRV